MSGFDPVSYAAGRKAGEKGGGREPVLETLYATDNGLYTPGAGVDGFSSVEVDVPSRYDEGYRNGYDEGLRNGYDDGEANVRSNLEHLFAYSNGVYLPEGGQEGFNLVEVDVPIEFEPLADQAGAGDLRYGTEAYDDQGNVVTGTLQDAHQRVPIFWDATNSVFLLTSAVLDRAMATLAADGALIGYMLCTGSGAPSLPIPVEIVPSSEVQGMIVLTGGVTTGSNDDKYVTQARINPATGAIDAEKTYYIRAITTLTRHLADWLADGDYMSLFLLA